MQSKKNYAFFLLCTHVDVEIKFSYTLLEYNIMLNSLVQCVCVCVYSNPLAIVITIRVVTNSRYTCLVSISITLPSRYLQTVWNTFLFPALVKKVNNKKNFTFYQYGAINWYNSAKSLEALKAGRGNNYVVKFPGIFDSYKITQLKITLFFL